MKKNIQSSANINLSDSIRLYILGLSLILFSIGCDGLFGEPYTFQKDLLIGKQLKLVDGHVVVYWNQLYEGEFVSGCPAFAGLFLDMDKSKFDLKFYDNRDFEIVYEFHFLTMETIQCAEEEVEITLPLITKFSGAYHGVYSISDSRPPHSTTFFVNRINFKPENEDEINPKVHFENHSGWNFVFEDFFGNDLDEYGKFHLNLVND